MYVERCKALLWAGIMNKVHRVQWGTVRQCVSVCPMLESRMLESLCLSSEKNEEPQAKDRHWVI